MWKETDSLHPDIEKYINSLKQFVTNYIEKNIDMLDEYHHYPEQKKIQMLIRANRFFRIKKEIWDYFIENIDQADIFNAFFSILHVNAEEMNAYKLCKAIVNNTALLQKYIIQ